MCRCSGASDSIKHNKGKPLTTTMQKSLLAGVVFALTAASTSAGVPYPTRHTPAAVDLGAVSGSAAQATRTVTVALKLRDPAAAEAALKSVYDPASAQFHHFMTPEQFKTRFAPSEADVARVSTTLATYGLKVTRASSTTLHATGSAAQLQHAFSTSLHTYEVAAHDQHAGYVYAGPSHPATLPAATASLVHGVFGLSDKPVFRPHVHQASTAVRGGVHAVADPQQAPLTANAPGEYTVADFAQHYNVTPLYKQGIDGKGRTLGIATLASFTPSDAYAYWSAIGLHVNPNRISVVNVDGGPGAPSDASGSIETTLDVEQSGGLAPGAKIIVYQAPNTTQGFIDLFATAIDANAADSISVSWGNWEWFNTLENAPVIDPVSGATVSSLQALHELFVQAALQGQSMFSAAGDSGAYDVNGGGQTPPAFSLALSVDSPASDPAITAAGGTTLPTNQVLTLANGGPSFPIVVKHEQVWSWDYLEPLCTYLQQSPIDCGIFPVGGGGGVSVEFRTPWYQGPGLPGVERSQPGQSFIEYLPAPAVDYYDLPAHFAGRNVPDVSANADPFTGYQVYYTSDKTGFGIATGYGGTSFVAPELNGVAILIDEYVNGRVGLLNGPLYNLARGTGYMGRHPILTAIRYGNNDFYYGSKGYNPGAGLGVIDVTQLAEALGAYSWPAF